MTRRIGFLSVAHMHSYGYAAAITGRPDALISGVWDPDPNAASAFAERFGSRVLDTPEAVVAESDGLIVTSSNTRHADLCILALEADKPVLCEKPLVTSEADGLRMRAAEESSRARLMTAFPCRYSGAFARLCDRVRSGEVGAVLGIAATNHGMCPFGWFVEVEESGGGAMMDHTVHVADLLRVLLEEEPVEVYAQTGNNMYGCDWEDSAMLHVRFGNGVFATIDASWSRPKSWKTWGDVKLTVVCERGVLELDMFAQALDVFTNGDMRHKVASYGSDLDAGLVTDFVKVMEGGLPAISLTDGLVASKVAIAGYESAASGAPVSLRN
ncbi:Gfo/Idh/MocA family oxidoreductase [Fimbriimonadia bacterium ATM]|nr:MAG: gfo/Idh/MocA family oxidoreductase [Armatimonadota bacterium]MBC6968405.1 gfo/Idh/MocA family oxidoreductase [Armatimonadota bacterium]MCE7898757.1 gfo/Idh/MocA family oxidoreductase [Armatimonadetes bacterium ATM1]MDL1928746.1 Gfo/Idh/MocA family oxidoreductase [Fimbriimonadia bacterium ATM]RIJ98475.1 MAG: gfo/Idh/MocA family oxidoreductase [Armatimonadota bacterium]